MTDTDTDTGSPATDPHLGPVDPSGRHVAGIGDTATRGPARPRAEADVPEASTVAGALAGRDAARPAGPGEPAPVASRGCGCAVTVSQWTGRESRALREALRMSLRAFAQHLGVSTSTVSGWENRNPKPLRLATQAVLDQALTLADADTRTRFGLILAAVSDKASGAENGRAHRVAGGSTVSP
ncbi:helix-turn-helix transcriptional regulator [Solwaraspora sp. WMMD1047]|uniref:helix-turn-helix domain-containing protein n=1 Tax=Solwaraspora sp. WMMD1047 TaxID=3016102 RepID=UPI002417D719|nr:helix-turn-helix transcriptional regulator [Solwaraspora sp. WMMD1047]MDG4833982.1 helix-turn-helix transcriptional regulator [Solwaraspora sp. WMMD1047]